MVDCPIYLDLWEKILRFCLPKRRSKDRDVFNLRLVSKDFCNLIDSQIFRTMSNNTRILRINGRRYFDKHITQNIAKFYFNPRTNETKFVQFKSDFDECWIHDVYKITLNGTEIIETNLHSCFACFADFTIFDQTAFRVNELDHILTNMFHPIDEAKKRFQFAWKKYNSKYYPMCDTYPCVTHYDLAAMCSGEPVSLNVMHTNTIHTTKNRKAKPITVYNSLIFFFNTKSNLFCHKYTIHKKQIIPYESKMQFLQRFREFTQFYYSLNQ